MIEVLIELHHGMVKYNIPDLQMSTEIPYRLYPRKKSEITVLEEGGHVKFDASNRHVQELFHKYCEKTTLGLCLDITFLPTLILNDSENRVAIAYDDVVTFMDQVVCKYTEKFSPQKRTFLGELRMKLFETRQEKQRKMQYDRLLKVNACHIVDDLQKLGIVTRNPFGTWNCLAPNI